MRGTLRALMRIDESSPALYLAIAVVAVAIIGVVVLVNLSELLTLVRSLSAQ